MKKSRKFIINSLLIATFLGTASIPLTSCSSNPTVGEKGDKGDTGATGAQGEKGDKGDTGTPGKDGTDGKSAYQIWLDNGHEGSEEDFLNWLKGSSNDANIQGLNFALRDDDTYAVSIGNAIYLSNITIPESYNGKKVTSIYSFKSKNLKSINLPNSIITIEDEAFNYCENLTNITIPNSVVSIGSRAFSSCTSFTSIIIPDSVTSIGEDVFEGCSRLTSITIGDGITTLKCTTFGQCNALTSLTIGKNVTSINGSFSSYSIVEIINQSSLTINKGDYGLDNVINIKTSGTSDIVNKDGYLFYTYNGTNYLIKYIGNDTELVLPSDYNGEAYEIYQYAFYFNNITSVVVSNKVNSIGDHAFHYCQNLKTVIISDSVTSIGAYAFYNCSYLTTITLGKSIINIGDDAFNCSGFTTLTLYYNGTIKDWIDIKFGEGYSRPNILSNFAYFYILDEKGTIAYNDKNYSLLTEVVIPEGVTSIPYTAFARINSITSVIIPNSVTSIGYGAFSGCTSLQYNEYDTAYYLGNESNPYLLLIKAKSQDITSCEINENCKFIGSSAFNGCEYLTSISIPDSVISIGSYAFKSCRSLYSITIPNSVTSIGGQVVSDCWSLTAIYYSGTYDEFNNITINANNNDLTNTTKYFYSEEQPVDASNKYWHYVDGVATAW